MVLRAVLHDGKPQSRAARPLAVRVFRAAFFHAVETLENPLLLAFGDSDPNVRLTAKAAFDVLKDQVV